MKIYGINEYKYQPVSVKSRVYQIASNLGLIAKVTEVSKNCINVKLNIDTFEPSRPYQKFGYDKKTRINAVCWHGFRDFLEDLYDKNFVSVLIDYLRVVSIYNQKKVEYKNKEDFYDKHESTKPSDTNCTCNDVLLGFNNLSISLPNYRKIDNKNK